MTIAGQVRIRDGEEGVCAVEEIDVEIARRYYALGGRLITIGSDSHAPHRVGRAFDKVIEKLKGIGFEQAYYFRNRRPEAYTL